MTVLAILPEDTAVYHASVAKPRAGASLSQWTAYWDKSGITAKRLKARADAIQAQRQAEYSARMEAEIEARAKKRAAQLYAEAERERIARLDGIEKDVRPSLRLIKEETSLFFEISMTEMLSQRRLKRAVLARHVVMYLAKEMTLKSFPQISEALNRSDHTTSVWGDKRIRRALQTDVNIRDAIAAIRRAVRVRLIEVSKTVEGVKEKLR